MVYLSVGWLAHHLREHTGYMESKMEAKLHLYIRGIAEARLGSTPPLPGIVQGAGQSRASPRLCPQCRAGASPPACPSLLTHRLAFRPSDLPPFTTTLKMIWHVYLSNYIVVGTLVSLNERMRITTPSTTFTRIPLIPVVKAVSIFMMVQFAGSV